MKIYRLAQLKTPIVWKIKAKVMGGNYNDIGVEIIANSLIEAKRKFYREYPAKARTFDPENVAPEIDFEKTKALQQKAGDDKLRAKKAIQRQKEKESDFAANQWDQFK